MVLKCNYQKNHPRSLDWNGMRRAYANAPRSASSDRDRSRSSSPSSVQSGKTVNYDEPVVVLSSKPPEALASSCRSRLRQVL